MANFTTWITKEGLLKLVKSQALVDKYYAPLIAAMSKFNINTENRQVAFISQVLHESGNLNFVKENLNYSADALVRVFGKYFPSLSVANNYARNPEKIANVVYNRASLGNTTAGDGYKYIGRGLIQLTGKSNYNLLKKDTGIDFVSNPSLLEKPENAALSAAWFWNKFGLNEKADNLGKGAAADSVTFKAITQKINGGQNGAADREENYSDLIALAKKTIVDNSGAIIKAGALGLGFFLTIGVGVAGYTYRNEIKKLGMRLFSKNKVTQLNAPLKIKKLNKLSKRKK